jgi:hypothetical protein
MKPLVKKVSLFFLSLLVLVSSFYGYLLPTVKAQPCDTNNNWCADLVCGTVAAPSAFVTTTGIDVESCLSLVPAISRAVFATQVPQPWYNQDFRQFGQKVFDQTNPDEIFGERYTYAQVTWIFNSLINMVCTFCHAQNPIELFQTISDMVTFAKGIIEYVTGQRDPFADLGTTLPRYGLIGQTYYVMALAPKLIFTDKIASGVDEVKYVASKFNIASPAYAQGLGYDKLGIGTIRGLWIATRNMAYLIAVVILIVAGFMIIFRTKISAQASVTIQMVIPRLVISLVLVTFSYAIVGFVIDMVYVIITAVLGLLSFTESVTGITIFNPSTGGLQTAITQLTGNFDFVGHFLGVYIVISILCILAVIIVPIVLIPTVAGPVVWAALAPVVGFLLGFFVWSIYVWARILGQLIVAYISLMLLTIAGPIMIIMDILPTSPGGFKKWFLCIVGNASVFVTYALLSIFIFMFFDNTTGGGFFGTNPTGFANDTTSTHIRSGFDLPLFPGTGYPRGMILQYLIFMGFFSMVPNIVNSVRNSFCKSADLSDFIERSVKDTVGQLTNAGKEVGSGLRETSKNRAIVNESARQEAASAGSGTTPPSTGVEGR